MSLKIIANQINTLRKEKKYKEALEIYKTEIHGHYKPADIKAEPWIIFSIMFCLRKMNNPRAALDFFSKTMKLKAGPDIPEQLIREYGWSLFSQADQKVENYHDDNFIITENIQSIEKVLDFLSFSNEYLLYTRLFFVLAELEMKRENPQWPVIRKRLEKFLPGQFSCEPSTIKVNIKGREKDMELASDLEKYYMLYTKTVFQLGEFEVCIRLCREALEKVTRFHHGNNLWITRRLALCYTNTGNLDKAIDGFGEILKQKSDWFIQNELALLFYQKKNIEKALILACTAALNGGFSEYKVNMFIQLGHMFGAAKIDLLPCRHFLLSLAVRKEKGWKVPLDLINLVETFQCGSTDKTAKEQYESLKKEWIKRIGDKKEKDEYIEGMGQVSAVLHEGSNGDGFINDDEGRGIYFRFPVVKGDANLIKKGLRVRFIAKKKEFKGKQVWNAIKVNFT